MVVHLACNARTAAAGEKFQVHSRLRSPSSIPAVAYLVMISPCESCASTDRSSGPRMLALTLMLTITPSTPYDVSRFLGGSMPRQMTRNITLMSCTNTTSLSTTGRPVQPSTRPRFANARRDQQVLACEDTLRHRDSCL